MKFVFEERFAQGLPDLPLAGMSILPVLFQGTFPVSARL